MDESAKNLVFVPNPEVLRRQDVGKGLLAQVDESVGTSQVMLTILQANQTLLTVIQLIGLRKKAKNEL